MTTTHRNEKSLRAMAAARASHRTRPPGAKQGTYTLEDAARDYRVSPKLVKCASELLLSGMDDLVASVDSDERAVTTAWKMMRAAAKAGNKSPSTRPTRGHYLYLIREEGERRWSKVGIGGSHLKDRLDHAQHGNPRKLKWAGTWWFRTKREAKAVETTILNKYPKAPGGNEWLEGVTVKEANEIATLGGGRRSLAPGSHNMGFRRKGVSDQLPDKRHRQGDLNLEHHR